MRFDGQADVFPDWRVTFPILSDATLVLAIASTSSFIPKSQISNLKSQID
ncbi:MAG: hypothetical protein JGK01_14130 [Microcoleus sp. PH2017_03_ELD_O_A]|nr:hypothetical protein [Microcoleus sp. PH2017_03_ELD_O_A]